MAGITLKTLLNSKTGASAALKALTDALEGGASFIDAREGGIGSEDASGNSLQGEPAAGTSRVPVTLNDDTLGWVTGSPAAAGALGSLLTHLAAKEAERRALAAEVLHLYREVHLIGQLSEQLAAVLDISAIGQSALDQAQRLIRASNGGVLATAEPGGPLTSVASFGVDLFGENAPPLPPASRFAASVMERGVAEIVNDVGSDPRALDQELYLRSLICAPLRGKQGSIGVIALANTNEDAYTAADLKLLDTIALLTASAVENAIASRQLLRREGERQALKLYLPPQVADLILESGDATQLEGVLQPITVLYADIRGFTTMSETMEARDVVQMLKEFFTSMSGVIFQCNGTVDKFIGDCIMALFGAPIASAAAARDGLQAAIRMQRQMELLNLSRRRRSAPLFHIGIGLHCGPAVVGNIGSDNRVQYTAIGDTVNVAARLTSKAAASQIIVSEDIRASIPGQHRFESLGEVELKGRATKMNIYSARWKD
jgi:class 3 adenylate cyclase